MVGSAAGGLATGVPVCRVVAGVAPSVERTIATAAAGVVGTAAGVGVGVLTPEGAARLVGVGVPPCDAPTDGGGALPATVGVLAGVGTGV